MTRCICHRPAPCHKCLPLDPLGVESGSAPADLTAAAKVARALGYTIRRTVDSEVVAYRKGEGVNSPAAYFTNDPADALATVQEMARRDALSAEAAALDPADAAKAAAESIAAAETEVERRDLLAAALHFDRAAAMTRRTVALYAGHGKRGQVGDRANGYDKRAFELRREHAERARRAAARKEAREAGHKCEDRADALTGEARARELDRAADYFDKAAANPTPGGQSLGHYAARARACREEVAAIRQGIETRKRAPVDVDSAIRGATVSGPHPRKRPEEGPRVIDMTPTWAGLAPALFLALTNGTPEGQRIAREELTRALAALDAHNAAAKAAPAREESTERALIWAKGQGFTGAGIALDDYCNARGLIWGHDYAGIVAIRTA